MSSTLRNGRSIEIALQPGQSLAVVAVTGSFSLSFVSGATPGPIASGVTGGTYGPYAKSVVVALTSSAVSEVDYDFGTAPAIESDTPVMAFTNPLCTNIANNNRPLRRFFYV